MLNLLGHHMQNDDKNLLTDTLKLRTLEYDSAAWTTEERKLRLCLLLELTQQIPNKRELLEKIAEIYADFNYPEDMEEFIYYMPAKNYDPSEYSLQENENRLINLFYNFLEEEKIKLQNLNNK